MQKLSEQELVRRDKLTEIRKVCNPYPDSFKRTHTLKEARNLSDGTTGVRVCGRIIFMRKMGKLSFVRIRELESDLQLEFRVDEVGEERYDFFKKLIDSGDFIGATGEIFTTQTGEKTLRVKSFEFLGKALRPLPEKFHGLQDTELKYRRRYVDLIMNQDSRNVFLGRSKFYAFLHRYLGENGFLEVETPIMQTAVSGAAAKPFFTHHNALNLDMNLRIAPETYLKQCIAAGFDRVYEVAKCFRNEGMDTEHLQEFTQVEWYVAYWNRFPRRSAVAQLLVEAHADNVPWLGLDQIGAGAAIVIAACGIGAPGADSVFPRPAVGGVPRLLLERWKLSDQKPGILVVMVRHRERIVVHTEGSQVLPLHQAASPAILSFLL